MTIKIHGNHIENSSIGISAPSNADLDIRDNGIIACGEAIDLREPRSLPEALGLRTDTPLEVLK